jgi:hypothetical protein
MISAMRRAGPRPRDLAAQIEQHVEDLMRMRIAAQQHRRLVPLLIIPIRLMRHETAIGEGPQHLVKALHLRRIIQRHQHVLAGQIGAFGKPAGMLEAPALIRCGQQ